MMLRCERSKACTNFRTVFYGFSHGTGVMKLPILEGIELDANVKCMVIFRYVP